MSKDNLLKYKNPIWQDKDNRHIVCEMLQPDGNYSVAHIVAGPESEGQTNSDYEALVSAYGIEDLDVRTEEHKQKQIEARQRETENIEVRKNRQKQEVLFNMKLEAFEIDFVKNSTNKDLKKLIRRSKSPLEVQAFTTILIQQELEKDEK